MSKMRSLDLSGKWLSRWSDGLRGKADLADQDNTVSYRYIEATEVHLDLMRHGIIGDIYTGMHAG